MRSTLVLSCWLFAGFLAPAVAAQASVPHDLMQLVPNETTTASQWHSDGRSAPLEGKVFGVVEALLEADLDGFALDACEILGVPEEAMREVRSVHNLVRSMGALLPWRELLGGEVVYAESNRSGMLLACRPHPSELKNVERGLAGIMGGLAGMLVVPMRYDVERDASAGLTLYRITPRGSRNAPALAQFAVRDGVVLLGYGQEYFGRALDFLMGADGERLATSVRYLEAFGELPENVAGRTYVDMRSMSNDLDALNAELSKREFNAGGLQGMLNGLVDLTASVETVASVVHCDGDLLRTETLTRFDPESSDAVRAGLAQPASSRMLEYIPADAYSFDMRGQVQPAQVFTSLRRNWADNWEPASKLLFAYDLFEATMGLSLERDVLSWMGSEQIQVKMPSRHSKRRKGPKPGESDTITICHVRDPEGARKCLERLEGIFDVLAPVALERTKGLLTQIGQEGMTSWIQLAREQKFEEFPELRRMRVMLPMVPMPPMVYGMVDDILVYGTSLEAVEACLAVARGEQEGMLDDRMIGNLMGRADLCSARMTPAGSQYSGWKSGLGMGHSGLQFLQGMTQDGDPRVADAVGLGLDLVGRLEIVLDSLGFMGETLTHSTIREQGLARYEQSSMRLNLPGASRDVVQEPRSGIQAKPVAHGAD